MCLTVNTRIHKKNGYKYIPFIAETDLMVYKCIDHNSNTGEYYTPFQYCTIKFKNGMCKMQSSLEYTKNISFGIHGLYSEKTANRMSTCFTDSNTTKHWAIIPKGSEFFIGVDADIVSNNLLVFKTREDYRKYRKEHNVKILHTFLKKNYNVV